MPSAQSGWPRPHLLSLPRRAYRHPCRGTGIPQSDAASFRSLSVGPSIRTTKLREELPLNHAPRSRLSCPWLLEVPTSGYTAPRPPVYAAIVSLGGEGGRPPGYYAQQMAVSISSLDSACGPRERTAPRTAGSRLYLKNINLMDSSLLEAYTSQPRCRRTVCLGRGFSLPPLPEEDANPCRLRSSSVVMGTQAFSMTSHKVNNIEKAEEMKTLNALRNMCENGSREEVRHNIENSRKIRAIEDMQKFLKNKASLGTKETLSGDKSSEGSYKRVSFSPGRQPESSDVALPGSRVRLSYVESDWTAERHSHTKKRLSWAAGEKLYKTSAYHASHATVVLNNRRVSPSHRKRSSSAERLTLYPRTASCVNIPKCKKHLSWASSEKRRFSWAPGNPSTGRDREDQRRYSFAGEESRRPAIRMGTRSLAPITPPPSRCPRHLPRPNLSPDNRRHTCGYHVRCS